MTDIKDINKGDRVRATSKENDDTAEFTVIGRYGEDRLDSRTNSYHSSDFDFELLKPADKPIPTEPGLYSFFEEDTPVTQSRRLLLTNNGEWYFLDFTGSTRDSVLAPVDDIQSIVNNKTWKHNVTPVYMGKQ